MRGCLAIGTLAFVLASAVPADAFLLVSTESGVPAHWKQQCIPWKLNELASGDLGLEDTHEALRLATEAWEGVEQSFLRFSDHGLTTSGSVGVADGLEDNIILWHEEGGWPYALRVVGLTSLTFDTDTGQIVGADIEMNGDDYDFAIDGDPDAYDAQQSLTHEVGHLLGLDHSMNEDAVMFADSLPGEIHKRVLHQDDEDGLSTSHPKGAPPSKDGCTAEPNTPTPAPSGGCAGSGPPMGDVWLVLVAWVACLGRRRRGVGLALGLVLVGALAPPASAGAPYTTKGGTPIFWPDDIIHYTLHPDLPDGLEEGSVQEAIDRGFDAWENLGCHPLTLESAGWETCPGEDPEDGVNCIRWRDKAELWAWPVNLVAVTLVHYWEDTAVIEDVDIDLNAFEFTWSTDLECQDEHHDLIATITHEAGHFIGLDHSLDGQATMNAATTAGDCQKRSLESDDEETFCGTYENRPEVDPEPVGDLAVVGIDTGVADSSSAEAEDDPPGGGGPGGDCQGCSGTSGGPWLSLWALTVWLRSRRRPGRGPPPSPAH